MSKPKHKPFSQQWIVNIPELKTRPVLCQALVSNRHLRHRVFQSAQALESIANIPSKTVAIKCLSLYWRETRRELYNHWHNRLREKTGSDTLYNELYGCLRNVYWNMRIKAGEPKPSHTSERSKKGEIVREYVS